MQGRVLDADAALRRVTLSLKKALVGDKLPPFTSWEVRGAVHGAITGARVFLKGFSWVFGVLGLRGAHPQPPWLRGCTGRSLWFLGFSGVLHAYQPPASAGAGAGRRRRAAPRDPEPEKGAGRRQAAALHVLGGAQGCTQHGYGR